MPVSKERFRRFESFAHRVLHRGVAIHRHVTDWLRKPASAIPENPERILLIKLWGMGPLFCAVPFVQSLRQRYPDAHFTLVTVPGNHSLYREGTLFDRVETWEVEKLRALPGAVRSFARRCSGMQYDLVINLEGESELAALLARVSGATASAGFVPRGEKRGYTVRAPVDSSIHATEAYGDLAAAMDLPMPGPVPPDPAPTQGELAQVREMLAAWGLDPHTLLIGINMDAHESPTARAWPPEKYVLLAQTIEEMQGYKTLFLGSPDEDIFVARNLKQIEATPLYFVGRTSSRQCVALLRMLHLLISSNTGPLQMAAAQNVATLGILQPAPARWFAPPESERHELIVREPGQDLSIEAVRQRLDDMLDHLSDPDEPPWIASQ